MADVKKTLQITGKLLLGSTGNNFASGSGSQITLSVSGNNIVTVGSTYINAVNGYTLSGNSVLLGNTLGPGITSSNLQAVGTLNSLTVNGLTTLDNLTVSGTLISAGVSSINTSINTLNTSSANTTQDLNNLRLDTGTSFTNTTNRILAVGVTSTPQGSISATTSFQTIHAMSSGSSGFITIRAGSSTAIAQFDNTSTSLCGIASSGGNIVLQLSGNNIQARLVTGSNTMTWVVTSLTSI